MRMDALSYYTRQRVTRVVLKVIWFTPHVAQAPNHIEGILSWQELPFVVLTLRLTGTYDPKILVETTQSLIDKLHQIYIKSLNFI
jgi:hypothetical protein